MSPKHTVYKKFSHDKSVGVYMGRRDFVDHSDSVDPVGKLACPSQLPWSIYVMLSCTFRYGRDDMDVLGMAFRRDVFLCTRQVYPPLQDRERCVHTRLQERLLHKLGHNAYPFFFEFPDNLPCSVGLQPAPTDVGKHCAVEFEVKAFCAENQEEKSHKRSSVRLAIRKVQYAPNKKGVVPSSETACEFMMSDRPLASQSQVSNSQLAHHTMYPTCLQRTNTKHAHTLTQTPTILSHTLSLSLTVEQITNVVLYSSDKYVKTVAYEESTDTVPSGTSLKKVYTLCPLLADNRERRGLALDGKLKHEDTNLASSSIVKAEVLKEILGMLVSYRVVVKATASGEVAVEVPFLLMHPKPEGELVSYIHSS
uniref:S-arrestin n=1 Tax=Electrophorus electricus TaxID=8005 RepID=A0AAY5ENS9_ELEEL